MRNEGRVPDYGHWHNTQISCLSNKPRVTIWCKVSGRKFDLHRYVLSQCLSWIPPSNGDISISSVIHGYRRNATTNWLPPPSQSRHMSITVSQITNKSNIFGQAKKLLLALCEGNPVTKKISEAESVTCDDIIFTVSEDADSVNYTIIITAACRFNFYSRSHFYLKLFLILAPVYNYV